MYLKCLRIVIYNLLFTILVFSIVAFIDLPSINALDWGDYGLGDEYIDPGNGCATIFGCNLWWPEVGYRVTMVDVNGKLIANTHTVEFDAGGLSKDSLAYTNPQPSSFSTSGYTVKYNVRDDDGIYRGNLYYGSYIAGTEEQDSKFNDIHYIYLGKDYGNDEIDARTALTNYIKSVERGIKVNDKNGVSHLIGFFDYFLMVSGYSDVYNSTSNYDIMKKLQENDYYLLIEPVYYYSKCVPNSPNKWVDNEYDCKHYVNRGTPKQLARYYTSMSDYSRLRNGNGFTPFYVGWDNDILRQHMCNFYSDSGVPFMVGNNTNCANVGNFNESFDVIDSVFLACDITDDYGTYTNYGFYTGGNNCEEGAAQRYISKAFTKAVPYLENLASQYSPYGVNVLSVKEAVGDFYLLNEYNCSVSVLNCNENDFKFSAILNATNLSDGKEAPVYNCVYPKNEEVADKTSSYIYNVEIGNNNSIWCYDDVTYDFTKVKTALENGEFVANQLLEIPTGTLYVNRKCYTKSYTFNGNQLVFDKNHDTYLNGLFNNDVAKNRYKEEFDFSFNNRDYVFVIDKDSFMNETVGKDIGYNSVTTNNKLSYNRKFIRDFTLKDPTAGYIEYSTTFHYSYYLKNEYANVMDSFGSIIDLRDFILSNFDSSKKNSSFHMFFDTVENTSSIIKVPSNLNGETSLTFNTGLSTLLTENDTAYGLTNGIISASNLSLSKCEKVDLVKQCRSDTINYSFSFDKRSSSCEVSATVIDNNIYGDGVIFRTISLSNPFPARDGTSRMPGENWLTESNNFVSNYIVNNRNVKEGDVYNLEPIYTITLDASTMINIRNYNKEHSYTDFSLSCNVSTGGECQSTFLRNTKYISSSNFGGRCVFVENTALREKIQECASNNLVEIPCYKSEYDLNNDGVVDFSDAQATTYNYNFYRCADKVYTSAISNNK